MLEIRKKNNPVNNWVTGLESGPQLADGVDWVSGSIKYKM